MLATCSLSPAQEPHRHGPQPRVRHELGPDSLPRQDVPSGRLEGPFLFRSEIIEDTVRKYWIFVPVRGVVA
ncbi:hypothetical protein [Tautonia plasticadhaerens]|uniref:Uncharacterized protein n=1 Tax=Tautonia plasticadhaerens TaxID=2527974 RepID=A0A518HEW2_9BACT|nr:hypothetical protein [Tautonia plasticadhaerens]QDV39385.1 hypothetical protein ElP_73510 [Tautonia plasticadhaerens]